MKLTIETLLKGFEFSIKTLMSGLEIKTTALNWISRPRQRLSIEIYRSRSKIDIQHL